MRLREQASSSHSLFRPFLWGIHGKQQPIASAAIASAATNSRGGLLNSQINSRQGHRKVPSDSKINPQTPYN